MTTGIYSDDLQTYIGDGLGRRLRRSAPLPTPEDVPAWIRDWIDLPSFEVRLRKRAAVFEKYFKEDDDAWAAGGERSDALPFLPPPKLKLPSTATAKAIFRSTRKARGNDDEDADSETKDASDGAIRRRSPLSKRVKMIVIPPVLSPLVQQLTDAGFPAQFTIEGRPEVVYGPYGRTRQTMKITPQRCYGCRNSSTSRSHSWLPPERACASMGKEQRDVPSAQRTRLQETTPPAAHLAPGESKELGRK